MIYGVIINETDTLHKYGLCLLEDVSIGAPEPKVKYVDLPDGDGSLDLSDSLTGRVSYGMREITFNLFAAVNVVHGKPWAANEWAASEALAMFMQEYHGKKVKLWLPDDREHYFFGRIAIGGKGGYNKGVVPVSMTAEPWKYKNYVTRKLYSVDGTYRVKNEQRPAIPTFSKTSSGGTLTFNGTDYGLGPGDNIFPNVVFQEGINTFTLSDAGVVTVSYQEARL